MSMPKGLKIERGYATVTETGGMGYREIAEKMSDEEYIYFCHEKNC